jgi:hypothetical protein
MSILLSEKTLLTVFSEKMGAGGSFLQAPSWPMQNVKKIPIPQPVLMYDEITYA